MVSHRLGSERRNFVPNDLMRVKDIEIKSWRAHAYGIFTRVGEVSEIEQVSAANE